MQSQEYLEIYAQNVLNYYFFKKLLVIILLHTQKTLKISFKPNDYFSFPHPKVSFDYHNKILV
jgi:hypothetical protein